MAHYEDFSITFGPRSGARYPVSIESRAGEEDGSFEPPISLDRLPSVLQSVASDVRDIEPATRGLDRTRPHVPFELGMQLYSALFAERRVRDCFMRSLGKAEGSGATLRVRLRMNLDDESVRPLATIPWELLHDPDKRRNLVEWPLTALVRSPKLFCSSERTPFTLPLRVLFVMANPRGDLDLDRERNDIAARLAAGTVPIEPHYLEQASYESLERRLSDEAFHIVHFMGHGTVDHRGGALLLHRDSDPRQEERVLASDIGRLMLAERSVRLVVLNACRTGQSAQGAEIDAYTGGVATSLLINEVPAVVAMQFPISDDGAAEFADRLYSSLAAGDTIEAAVRKGRRAIRHEWPIPVLFSQWDGPLFPAIAETKPIAPAAASPRFATPSSAVRPLPAPAIDAELRDLLPYLVDRRPLRDHLREAIREQAATVSTPLVAIVPGDDTQSHDSLVRRLFTWDLPELLGLGDADIVTQFPIGWPDMCAGRADLHARLTSAIMDKVKAGVSTIEDAQRYFATIPGPVMLHTTVESTDWQGYRGALLDDYVSYWQAWPATVAPKRLLVFLFVRYQTPDAGWLKGRKDRKMNEAIERALGTLGHERPDRIILRVCPALGDIQQKHVEEWNADHGYPLAVRDIERMYERHAGGRKEMSMNMVGDLLAELIAGRMQASGGGR
jgi:hypothetical protein